jgi:mono/diheme cytochrome c family protein
MILRAPIARRRRPALAIGVSHVACVAVAVAALGSNVSEEQETAAAGTAVATDATALVNPVPFDEEAIARGRKHYLRLCQTCHGYDGRALENIDYEAADLTNPEVWRFGTTDGDLFRNTKDGAGQDMPPFGAKLEDREIWELVHYLRSIGPEKLRPKPVAAATAGSEPPGR